MSTYKPYKPVPIGRRCPHGYDRHVCATCVAAEQSASAYAQRQRDKEGHLREHERMRKMGQRVVVIDSIEGVEELLR